MSNKPVPYDVAQALAQSVRKLLHDEGPLTAKEILKRLRKRGSPLLKSSAINKVLGQTMADELQRLPGNTYTLLDE